MRPNSLSLHTRIVSSDLDRPSRPGCRVRALLACCQDDPIRLILWLAGIPLAAVSAALLPHPAAKAAAATLVPFGTLAAIILGAVLADRLGAFAFLERILIPARGPRIATAAAILGFTALLSALVNLDVAVVVGVPVALRAARRHPAGPSTTWESTQGGPGIGLRHQTALAPGRLVLSVAITANATSFLLPTSNITNLLLLGRAHLPTLSYLSDSWLPWLLVTAVTVGTLAPWSAGPSRSGTGRDVTTRLSVGMLADLLPLFLIAAGIRALLGSALVLHGTIVGQLAWGSAIASVAGNLPAAATLVPVGTTALWTAVLATTIGPNLLITGSIATLISRRIAAGGGAQFSAWRFSAIGLALLPVQFALAILGLHIAGVFG